MSNVETDPQETVCPAGGNAVREGHPDPQTAGRDGRRPLESDGRRPLEILEPRDVPLGGPRAMTVRRTLPQRQRSLIGAWCFADHYGPDDVSATDGMDVPPHPHTGLQTVSWLFTGQIEHRDSVGSHAMVRPGELNLMTGGRGIAHSEVSSPETTTLHGAQLWVALPDAHRDTARDFQHYAPTPRTKDGATVAVFLGSLAGQTSPVQTFTPLLGAEVTLDPGARIDLDLDPAYEHGVLADIGSLTVEETALSRGSLAYLPTGCATLTVANTGDEPARCLVLGGPPFEEDILMWWNFVARTHDEIVAAREEWMAHSERFGEVEGYAGEVQHLPAPVMPAVRIRPRTNPSRPTRDT